MKTATLDTPKPQSDYLSPTVGGLPVYRLSVAKYHQMIEHHILDEDDPVELLEGILVEKHAPSYETLPIFRLSVERYHQMIQHGILGENDPVELLDGILVTKMSKNTPHSVCTRKIRRRLDSKLPKGWFADTQEPVTTIDSELEPDDAVVRGEPDDYLAKHPTSADVALLVEVSESTLTCDRGPKKRSYAEAGFPVYWIVNLLDRQIEVHTEPTGAGENADYTRRQVFRAGDSVPLVLDGLEVGTIPVADLLP